MGAFARAMDRLAEWVRWLAEAVRLLKPRQNPQNAQGVLEAFLSGVPVDERTEDELRAEGVPVDDIKDTEEREHGLGSETDGVPAEGAEAVVGEEGAGPGGAVRADSEPVGADASRDAGTGDVERGAEPAQAVRREETREERLERRARKRREANEIRERLNRLMKKNRKYGGRRMSVEVPEAAYSAQKFSTETSDDYQTPNKDELKSRIAEAMNVDKDNGRVIKHSAFVTISKMPPLLKWVGLGDGNIETQAFVLRKIKNVHHLTADDVAELPQYYEDPVAVFKDGDNFIVLTNYLADDGNGRMAPVMVYLERTKRGNNYIASIYSRTEKGEAKYANLANGGNLLYVNTEKVAVLPLKDGAKSPITTLVAKGDPNLKTEKGWATAQSEDTIAQNRPGVKFSTETDRDYLQAVEMNDLVTAQQMVLDAARRAGYAIEAYHGVRHKGAFGFTRFDFDKLGGILFAGSLPIARTYSGLYDSTEIDRKIDETIPKRLKLKETYSSEEELFQDLRARGVAAIDNMGAVYLRTPYGRYATMWRYDWGSNPSKFARELEEAYNERMENAEKGNISAGNYHLGLKMENPLVIHPQKGAKWNDIEYNGMTKNTREWAEFAKQNGYDGVIFDGLRDVFNAGDSEIVAEGLDERKYESGDADLKVYIVFGEDQVKSLDPVVRDDAGNVIPLSKRFNPAHPDIRYSTEKPGDEGLSATVRSVREALRRDGDKAVELLGGTILSNYVREETDAALRKRVARAAVERLFNVVPVSEERLRQAGLIEETLALPEDEDEVASEYEDAKIVDARNRREHGGVLVGESQAEAVVRARAKQVLGKTFRYLFEVYHGTPHAGWTRWERGHGGTTGLGYAYFAPRVITAAEYADTSEAPNKGLADVKDMQRYGISEAVYHMVVGMNNPLIVDCRRASWNNIRMKNKRTVRTDEILNVARFGELGYDGVIFLNVHDSQLSVKLHGYDVDVDLTEVTVTTRSRAKESPPTIPLSAAVEQVAQHQGAGFSPSTEDTIAQNLPGVKFSTEKPGDVGMSATVRNVQETLRGYWTT